jgi:predicted lipoprotein with Yx(FWY)xxD motif
MQIRHADRAAVPTPARRRLNARLALVAALLIAVVLIAGCGGSSSKSSSTGATSSSGGSSSGSSTVKVAKVSGYGSALVSASGKSLYLLSTDPSGGSKCLGACAKTWIPLTVSGTPSAGSGAKSSLLSTFKRSDGTTQVLYDKHALYTYSGTGTTSGEGQASDGGVWYLVSPSGSAIKHSSAGGY